ncbi:hypothetical protein MWU59_07250 [Flavobacteriaceae bacterium F08102]|nr:hypothetical protein [Flavobacteriaceae bacterium F08102]
MIKRTKKMKWLVLCLSMTFLISCTTESTEDDIIDPKDDGNTEVLDFNAKGDCKPVKMILTNGSIRNSYTITYNAEGKITQAIGDAGKYTFTYSNDTYFYSNYNAQGKLTLTKEVQLNNNGDPISFVESQYADNGEVYRVQVGTYTYVNNKLDELKISEDGYQIRLYRFFWENGNITEVEDNGFIERKYEYYGNYDRPTDYLNVVDLMGYLQTGVYFLYGNANLMKHSEVDTIISDFTYRFNDHGKLISQKIIRNDMFDPIYFTPTYECQ